MLAFFHRVLAAIAQARADNAAAADGIALDNLRRLLWLAGVMLAINLFHVLAFQAPAPDATARVLAWKQALRELHLGMAGLAAALGVAAWWLQRRPRPSATLVQACGVAAFALALGFAVLVTAVDQWVTPSITPFLIACALVGVVILQRPLTAAILYGAALLACSLLLGQTQADAQVLLSNRVNAYTAALLGWTLATLSWRRTVLNRLLARQLAQRQRELEAQQLQLQHLATHDGLTGLVNRAEVERLCRAELSRAQRHGLPLALLVIDLDNFKRINDRWGHPVGDAVLVATADALRRSVRASDVLARIGGEEFMVLLPHTTRTDAQALAEKLRLRLAALVVPAAAGVVAVTASVGVAAAPAGEGSDFETLYSAADRALYRAKSAGRDRVEIA